MAISHHCGTNNFLMVRAKELNCHSNYTHCKKVKTKETEGALCYRKGSNREEEIKRAQC